MSLKNYRLVLVGCGNLGKSLLKGWQQSGIEFSSLIVVNPRAKEIEYNLSGVSFYDTPELVPISDQPTIIVFAIKPQIAEQEVNKYTHLYNHNAIICSVMAGKTSRFFQKIFGLEAKIFRAMPNINSSILRSLTAYQGFNLEGEEEREMVRLFSSIGKTFCLTNEDKFAEATAIFGSAPAFAALFADCLSQVTKRTLDLSDSEAREVAISIVADTMRSVEESGLDMREVIRRIASPNGTTEKGLKFLEHQHLGTIIEGAIRAASERARELSG